MQPYFPELSRAVSHKYYACSCVLEMLGKHNWLISELPREEGRGEEAATRGIENNLSITISHRSDGNCSNNCFFRSFNQLNARLRLFRAWTADEMDEGTYFELRDLDAATIFAALESRRTEHSGKISFVVFTFAMYMREAKS